MKAFITTGAGLTFIFSLITGCNTGENKTQDENVTVGKYEFSNGWVRPGSEGGNSAVYLRITNGTATDDTLVGLSTDVSDRASLHETREKDGFTEMHSLENLSIKSGTSMNLEPGGKHIMLMQLDHNLTEGDSVKLIFDFARAGNSEVKLPVRLQE